MKEKILIIEDDPQFVALLKHSLSKEEYHIDVIIELENVEDIIEQVLQREPDLILSDILMKADGFELLKVIKSDSRLRMIPFVFISGVEPISNKIKAYLGGADNYISKPIQKDEIIAKIGSILKRQKNLTMAIYLDPLTQIHNRRFFNKELKRQIKLHRRHGDEFTITMLDLDHFKSINDTYGHTCGDQCLVAFANFIRNEIRSTDIFARWGGEEFVLILERSVLMGASKTVQKILDELTAQPLFSYNGHDIPVSFSAGIAQYPTHGKTDKELIEAADQALYLAKDLGRKRVEIYKLPGD